MPATAGEMLLVHQISFLLANFREYQPLTESSPSAVGMNKVYLVDAKSNTLSFTRLGPSR
jgi:hypothetical protein